VSDWLIIWFCLKVTMFVAPFMHLLMDCLYQPYKIILALVGFVIVLSVIKMMCQCFIRQQRRGQRNRNYEYSENFYPAIASNDVIINNLPDRSGLYYYNKEDKTLVYEGDLKVAPVLIIPEDIREEESIDSYRKIIPNAVCVNEQVVPMSPLHQNSCYYSPVYITNTHNRGSSFNEDFDYVNLTSRNHLTGRARDSYEYSRV